MAGKVIEKAEKGMSRKEALESFDNYVGTPGSVEIARDTVQQQLEWLQFVAEHEFTKQETKRLLKAYRDLFALVRPLTAKYID